MKIQVANRIPSILKAKSRSNRLQNKDAEPFSFHLRALLIFGIRPYMPIKSINHYHATGLFFDSIFLHSSFIKSTTTAPPRLWFDLRKMLSLLNITIIDPLFSWHESTQPRGLRVFSSLVGRWKNQQSFSLHLLCLQHKQRKQAT